MNPEEYLNLNHKKDDWSRLEEGLLDTLWTNNVLKYMEDFAVLKEKEIIKMAVEKIEKEKSYDMGDLARYYNAGLTASMNILNSMLTNGEDKGE